MRLCWGYFSNLIQALSPVTPRHWVLEVISEIHGLSKPLDVVMLEAKKVQISLSIWITIGSYK